MEALNQPERSKALVKFIVIFSVTVLLAIVAIFFDFKVPAKKNKLLKEENRNLQAQISLQEGVSAKMDSIEIYLGRMADPKFDFGTNEEFVNSYIAELKKYENDSTSFGRMIKRSNSNYLQLKVLRKQLRETGGSASERIKELEKELKKTEDELEDCEKEKNNILLKKAVGS
ncbi:MAG: hypothetical protein IT223_03215 [Crocinitomicaceae bacterium]|nr:hypothetical protein [Crocinitomicaceae bacterium]